MYIEVSDYYDSRVNIDIERFYQLPFQDSEMVLQEAYELYNKTRQWAIDAGIYEGSDVYYNRTLDIFSGNMLSWNTTRGDQNIINNNRILIIVLNDLYKQINPNLICYSNPPHPKKYPTDVILVIRGTYDYQMFESQTPLDNNLLTNILSRDTLNKNCPIREKITNNLYKNSKPFQIVNNDIINGDIENYNKIASQRTNGNFVIPLRKNDVYLGLGYGEINSKITINKNKTFYDRKKIDPNIEIISDIFNEDVEINDYYVNYPMIAYIFKPATFSEIIAFVMARRCPLN